MSSLEIMVVDLGYTAIYPNYAGLRCMRGTSTQHDMFCKIGINRQLVWE